MEPSPPELVECPDVETLFALVGGYMPEAELAGVQEHLAGCEACCHVVAEAMRELGGEAEGGLSLGADGLGSKDQGGVVARALPAVGDRVGRFMVMEVLGRGAMGIVYGAYDPELDRKVALKLVRFRGSGEVAHSAGGELEARLLGEAQAMARVAHPNVVAVHDIGMLDGGLYIAMEHVTGQTLRDWLKAAERPWKEIVAAFVQAGEGLAAAHAEGIVHRDFKPDNVLVDRSGRVRVTDFGLARVGVRSRVEDVSLTTSDLRRTRAGTIVGTPAYMAPEQLDGGTVDARADVFAFGASLYEALYGKRPYPGQTLGELERALRRGVPEEPPASKVPGWVKRVVLRALAGDPAARWPSMATLLEALRSDPRKKVLRVGVPIAAAAVVAGTLWGVWHITGSEARGCRASAEVAAGVWDEERRDGARAAFEGTGKAFASEAFRTVSAAMSAYVEGWRAARIAACNATHEEGVQSEALLDLRLRCLDQRLAESEALAARFEKADASVVESAAEAVARLPPPDICADAEWLEARVPRPADATARARVEAAEALLAKAEAATWTGAWEESKALAKEAADLAHASGHAPTEAEALVALAWGTFSSGKSEEAMKAYEEAYPLAIAGGDDRAAVRAAMGQAGVIAFTRRDKVEALRWARFAEAQNERLGRDPTLSIELLTRRADVLFQVFEAKDAIADLERAVAMTSDTAGGPTHVGVLSALAMAYQQAERYDEAVRMFERALGLARRVLGLLHPRTIALTSDLGGCLGAAGHYRAAEDLLAEAEAQLVRYYPGDHRDTASVLLLRGAAATGLGRFDAARELHTRSIGMFARLGEQLHGSDILIVDTLLAHNAIRAGSGEEAERWVAEGIARAARVAPGNALFSGLFAAFAALALELNERPEAGAALALLEKTILPSVGATVASMIVDAIGRDLVRRGHPQEGVRRHQEALDMLSAHYGDKSLELAPTYVELGRALLAAGRTEEARGIWERAFALVTGEESDPLVRAEVFLGLARALRAVDPGRASRLERDGLELVRASPYPRARRLVP